jgi:hypothetical protein
MGGHQVPSSASDIHRGIARAVGPHSLTQSDRETIIDYINRELPAFYTPVTTYVVLGSYHHPHILRLRAAAHELNKRPVSFALVVGDTPDFSLSNVSSFRVKFHVLCTAADWVVGVYEKDTKGESNELGKIAEDPYFPKSFVFPRDYHHPDADITTKSGFIAAAIVTYFDDDLDDDETRAELEHLLAEAEDVGVDVTAQEFVTAIQQREAELDHAPIPTYSWPHLEDFRHFELAGRCITWHIEDELREKIVELPGPDHSSWETNEESSLY